MFLDGTHKRSADWRRDQPRHGRVNIVELSTREYQLATVMVGVDRRNGGRFQHVEDLLLLLDIAHQVRLVGMAVLAKHPTVKLDAYRLFEAAMRWSNSDLL